MLLEFFNKKRVTKDLYLGLFLKENEGIALVLVTKNGRVEVKEKEKFVYSNNWENLAEDVDEVLFRLEKDLNITFDKTIFFIYSHLLNDKGTAIEGFYLNKIKELIKELNLSPLGYIECYEAVALYLTEKEKMPITAILIELDTNQLSIFIYKGGKLSHRKILTRSENLINDLTVGFSELKGKFLLPARIILYNSKDLDEVSEKILTHRWSQEHFIQLPKVEILREEEVIEGLAKVFQEQEIILNQSPSTKKEEKQKIAGFVVGGEVTDLPSLSSWKIFSLINKILMPLKKINLPEIKFTPRMPVVFGVLFVLIGLMINEIFFHKATLTIFAPSLIINKSTTIQVPYKIATVSAEFSHSKNTSGKKEIGEKATGEVTIYNTNLNREKVFKKGTEIELDGLKFIFNNEVKVASATSGTNPGIGRVKVTAASIGNEYNLSKGKRFNIDDTSYAEVTDGFTGGSKKEIQTVSQKDIEDLKTAIIEKAKKTNKLSLRDLNGGLIIPQLSEVTLKEVVSTSEVGEQASTVTVKAKIDSNYYYYQKNKLLTKLVDIINPQIPSGFILNKETINYFINSATKKEELVFLDLSYKAKAIKKISQNEVFKKITGKHKNVLNNLLKNDFQVEGYEINIKTALPILKDFLPFISNNITLVISSL